MIETSLLEMAPRGDKGSRMLAAFGSAALHALLFALVGALDPPHAAPDRPPSVTEIEMETLARALQPPAPILPTPVTPVTPARPSQPAQRTRPARSPAPAEPAPAPAPAPPQAPLAAETVGDATGPLVSATAATFAGGLAGARGTSPSAAPVALPARAIAGATPGTGDGPNRSRAPQLAGTAEWRCPFPLEADSADIDRAIVTLRVEVAADGSVARTTALDDPGHGFARQAQRCALRKRWAPGLDRAGQPSRATAIVRVRFER